jgi:hypothetical protein
MEADNYYFTIALIAACVAAACAVYIFVKDIGLITISFHAEDNMAGTMSEVHRFLDQINKYARAGDDEAATSVERDMHLFVLQAIADGCVNPHKIAEVALRSKDIGFIR